MRFVAIDKGNSRIKLAFRTDNEDPQVYYFNYSDEDSLLQRLQNESFEAAVMSSVTATKLGSVSHFLETTGKFLLVDKDTPIPIGNAYATPATLGTDRIAGAVGAWKITGGKDLLLVDAGTCINYECVLDNTYSGGAIAPGLRMRLKAMHEFTGKLPLLEIPDEKIGMKGDSTASCMLSGAIWGAVKEIEGVIADYKTNYGHIQVVLSGGDGAYLGKYLKNDIFAAHKEVVITGLLEILKFNLND